MRDRRICGIGQSRSAVGRWSLVCFTVNWSHNRCRSLAVHPALLPRRQVELRELAWLYCLSTAQYFVCGLSPPKRRVVRWRNFARRRVPTMCRTCAGFYVYRDRHNENNGIFPKMWCGDLNPSVRPQAVGLHQPAGWMAATARWPARLT